MITDKLKIPSFLESSKSHEGGIKDKESAVKKAGQRGQREGHGPEGGQNKETFENRNYLPGQKVNVNMIAEGERRKIEGNWKLLEIDKKLSKAIIYNSDDLEMKILRDKDCNEFLEDNKNLYRELDEVVFSAAGSTEEREGRIIKIDGNNVTVVEQRGKKADAPRAVNIENVSKKFKIGQQVRFFPPEGGTPQMGKIENISDDDQKITIATDAGEKFTVDRGDVART